MNLVLLSAADMLNTEQAAVRDQRRIKHIIDVHGAQVGDELKVGLVNGAIGQGIITALSNDEILLDVQFQKTNPTPLPLTLVLALPRPKMLKRILQTIATLGVKKLYLINSYRVEKSYWQTPFLQPEAIHEQLILGLEQGCDTHLPEVHLMKRFKPFVEDELPTIIANTQAIVAHPYTENPCPRNIDHAITLAVGPEGGFIPYEINLLQQCGFEAVHLGERIMRVETAIPYLIGRLY